MLKRPHYIAMGVVLGLVLVLVNLPNRTATQIKVALGGLFLPLFGLATSTQTLAVQARNQLVPRRALLVRLEELERENQQLQLKLAQNAQLWQENSQLRQAVGWQRQMPWKTRLARVISRDPANWWRTLWIDVGAKEGVATNLAVLTGSGLVGRISQVGLSTSQVVLIGDPNCRVPALVEETRDAGILSAGPTSVMDESLVDLIWLPRGARVKPGQRVITSGFGGVFPKGIVIGHVADSVSVGYGLYTEAQVKLSADLNHLEEVFVVMPQ